MSFVRQNLLSGTLSATLGSAATSMSSAELAALAAITTPDRARLVLDPQGANGTPEIIDVTAHTASATTATIARAVEDADRFPAREHAEGTAWHLADTVESFEAVLHDGGLEIMFMTSNDYDDLLVKDPNVLYLIVG